jgi:hypothetical protein
MSSNARTPQSVLDAPHLTPVTVVAQSGQNRVERRQVKYRAKGRTRQIPRSARDRRSARMAERNLRSNWAHRFDR